MLHQLGKSRRHVLRRVVGKSSDGLLGGSPLVKEIENFASNRPCRDCESLGEVMKNQPTVLPVGEQASCPSQRARLFAHQSLCQISNGLERSFSNFFNSVCNFL